MIRPMNASTPYYDIAVAWTWQFDGDFVRSIRESAGQLSLRVLEITKSTVNETLELVRKRSVQIGFYLDRASDEDEAFLPLVRLLQKRRHDATEHEGRTYIINPPDLVAKASDKAT
ncbi:MAG: hypothetical protein LUO89_02105, partial [Methanothrix sp.]|nr:hypothetical protein [Methanothrix sp.]